jgi:hypothetical protein
MGYRYTLFNSVREIVHESDSETAAKDAFDKYHKDGFAGWLEGETGKVIAGRKPIERRTLAPTWTGMLPMLLALYEDGKPDARAVALEELQRMARIADQVRS